MAIEFTLPALGENIDAADVVKVLVKQGDTITKDQPVLEMETEKAVLELPCPHAGKVKTVHVKAGDHVATGEAVLTLEETDEAAAPAAKASDAEKPPKKPEAGKPKKTEHPALQEDKEEEVAEAEQRAEDARQGDSTVTPPAEDGGASKLATPDQERSQPPAPASPAIRRLARELGVDLMKVNGTGPAGRITEEDLHGYVRKLSSSSSAAAGISFDTQDLPDFAQWGPVDRQPISNIRRKTAQAMTTAWRMVPQVTQYDLCDITNLEVQRKEYMRTKGEKGPKITVTAILLKAVVAALREFPKFSSSFDSQAGEIVYKNYFHVGVAVDTENGLLVPVVRDVDRKSIVQLAKELDELATKARQRKLSMEEMRGSCFTITNLGGIGGTAFSPIVYWPEVAILGVARARQEEVVLDGSSQIRLIMPLCLSYDHRVIDGADGARFTRRLATILSDPLTLFMET